MTLRVPDGTFGGTTLKKTAIHGFILTETAYSPGLEVPWHEHERASLCFVLQGSFAESFESRTQSCDRFDLTFKPAGESHRDEYGRIGARSLVVEIGSEHLSDLGGEVGLRQEPIHFGDAAMAGFAMRIYREFLVKDGASHLAIEGAVLELLAEVARLRCLERSAAPPVWLGRVKDMLEDCWDEDLSLTRLAAVAGVHPVHLAQVFRRRFGCPVGDYVRQIRVRRARERITRGDQALAQIAVSCGFYDQSHFTKVFKRFTRMTPGELRSQLRDS